MSCCYLGSMDYDKTPIEVDSVDCLPPIKFPWIGEIHQLPNQLRSLPAGHPSIWKLNKDWHHPLFSHRSWGEYVQVQVMKPFWNSSIILGFFFVHWVNFGRVEPGPLENIYSHIVILLISFRISCDVIFGVWKVWLIWWHQSFALKLMESISPETCAIGPAPSLQKEHLRHGRGVETVWGPSAVCDMDFCRAFEGDSCIVCILFLDEILHHLSQLFRLIILPSTVALSNKREICLNLHALIWLSHGPLICCPRWWFQCLMFSVSYNTS